jgi:hypothetical protein
VSRRRFAEANAVMAVANLYKTGGEVGSALAVALERTRPSNLGLAVEKGHQPTAQELAALGGDIITIRYDDR